MTILFGFKLGKGKLARVCVWGGGGGGGGGGGEIVGFNFMTPGANNCKFTLEPWVFFMWSVSLL